MANSNSNRTDSSVQPPPLPESDDSYWVGIPERCQCGGRPIIETYRGRRFYTYGNTTSGVHLWKPWDKGVTEDVRRLKYTEFPNLATTCHYLENDLHEIEATLNHYSKLVDNDIAKLQEFKEEAIAKIKKLEKLLREHNLVISPRQVKIALVSVVVVASIAMFLKYY